MVKTFFFILKKQNKTKHNFHINYVFLSLVIKSGSHDNIKIIEMIIFKIAIMKIVF